MTEPRELTATEVRKRFLQEIRGFQEYWVTANLPNDSIRGRLEGMVFSILCMIDGIHTNQTLPGFSLMPHTASNEQLQSDGEDWYPECDIAGDLGEDWLRGKYHDPE